MKQRPFVVELLGPAGAGKSTLLRCLAGRDRSIRVDLGVWTLPRPLLFLGAVQRLTTILGLFRAARSFVWEEGKFVIKLRALYHQLQLLRFTGCRAVVFDEGPVFALSWLCADAHHAATNGGLASWWPKAVTRWARAVDMVVFLDAPNPVLAQRIRARSHSHPVKDKSDAEIAEYLERHRVAYARVLSDLQGQDGLTVLSFHTDQQATAQIADRLLAVFERQPAMGADAASAPLRSPSGSLTRTAALNAIASLFNYGAQLVANLVVTPILVSGLGASLFGVWEMLRQSVGYMTAADGRPTDALRLVIANQQARDDARAKRRYVGAALAVWLLFLPVVALAGTILVWLAPLITKVGPELYSTIRVTCALLVLSFLAGTLGAIPESVLRGMNLGYKRMGWQAGLSVVGALLLAGAIRTGWGLRGLGGAQIVLAALTGLCFWILVRKYVPAFGVTRPTMPEVRSLVSMSAWLTGGSMLSHLLFSSDVLILGMVLSPAVVATYVLTGAAARMALGVFNFTVDAAMPGLGGVIGQQQYERASQIRSEIMTLTWLFVTAVGATILLWNRSFLSLWVGGQHYAGVWPNLLIVCIAAQLAVIRSHQEIIDATLRPRPRVVVAVVAATTTITAGLALTPSLGIVGVCLGILAGRSTQAIAYPLLVASALRRPRTLPLNRIMRPLAVTVSLFSATAYWGERVLARGWLAWLAAVALSFGLALGVTLLAGLSADARRSVLHRCAALGRAARE